jgi:hypothetical protein
MHHHEANAERREQCQLRGSLVERFRVAHHVAAQLDHEDAVTVGAHIAERTLESGNTL